jgi:hypothetical protein
MDAINQILHFSSIISRYWALSNTDNSLNLYLNINSFLGNDEKEVQNHGKKYVLLNLV